MSDEDNYEARRQAAWDEYFAEHPEVLASWSHQNGYWPPTRDGDDEEYEL